MNPQRAPRTGAAVSGLLAAAALAGCDVEPRLISADSQQSGEAVIVGVTIPAEDAAKIKSHEMYTHVRVGDCEKMEDGYPAEAYVDGAAVSYFAFSTEGKTKAVSGSIPAHIFQRFKDPCATLEGGGYLSGVLVSVPQSIKVEPAR